MTETKTLKKILNKEKEVEALYTKRFGKWPPDAANRARLACQMLGRRDSFKNVLDATGFFPSAFIFSEFYKNAHVTIQNICDNDILPEFGERIRHHVGDITELKYPDKFFDLVYLGETIEHIYDIRKCLQEVKRTLKPGGYIAITTPNLASWLNRLLLILGKCPINYHPAPISYKEPDRTDLEETYGKLYPEKAPLYHFHIRVFTLARLIDYLKFMGFEIVKYDFGNFKTSNKSYKLLSSIMPRTLKSGIILIAKVSE